MKNLKLIACVAGVVGLSQIATAAVVNGLDGTQNWFPSDNRVAGTSSVTADQPRGANAGGDPGANGSLKLTTLTAADKATANYPLSGGPLGQLGGLTTANGKLSYDYYTSSTSTALAGNANAAPTFRMYVTSPDNSFTSLVYERAYQPGTQSTDTWNDNVDLKDALFWIRTQGTNFDNQLSNLHTLAQWEAGATATNGALTSAPLSATSNINGIETGFGSGITGSFTGFVDDIVVGFDGGQTITANFEVPEPASLGLLAIGGLLLARRPRKEEAAV
jgi:hypothetical protein